MVLFRKPSKKKGNFWRSSHFIRWPPARWCRWHGCASPKENRKYNIFVRPPKWGGLTGEFEEQSAWDQWVAKAAASQKEKKKTLWNEQCPKTLFTLVTSFNLLQLSDSPYTTTTTLHSVPQSFDSSQSLVWNFKEILPPSLGLWKRYLSKYLCYIFWFIKVRTAQSWFSGT